MQSFSVLQNNHQLSINAKQCFSLFWVEIWPFRESHSSVWGQNRGENIWWYNLCFFKSRTLSKSRGQRLGHPEERPLSMGRFIKKTCLVSVRLRVWFAVNQGHGLWLPCMAHNTLAPLQSAAVSWQEAACVCYELTSVNVRLPLRLPPLLRRTCGPQSSFACFYVCVWKGATEK